MASLSRLSLQPASNTATSALKETASTRQVRAERAGHKKELLKAELEELQKFVVQSRMQDPLTKGLDSWCKHFLYFIGLVGTGEKAIEAYIPLLRDTLIDPLTQTPLGEEPLLGSDGKTYSEMSLTNYFNGVPELYRKRSPLAPFEETLFTKKHHPVAKRFIKWLKDHGEYKPSQDEMRQYRTISATGNPAAILSSGSDEVARRVERMRAQNSARVREERKDDRKDAAADLEADAARIFREEFAIVDATNEQLAAGNTQALRQGMDQMRQQIAEAQRIVARLQAEAAQLRRDNEALAAEIRSTQANVSEAEQNTKKLKSEVNEARRELAENKSNWLKDLCVAAAIVGACWGVGWALTQVLAQMGSAAAPSIKAGGDSILGGLGASF